MPLLSGQTLNNRYRIERLLGEGGFGAVYLAWDLNLDGLVAVKENTEPLEASRPVTGQSVVRQFQLEAKILFQLRHPNLPRVSDYFIIPGQGQYLVMDYIEGEDLEKMLERSGGPLPSDRALGWILQVCEALSYMHNQQPPIIHRDIKPANIRITRSTSDPNGQALLVDFGIAKLYSASSKTTVGARAVTYNYSPPEQYGLGATDAQSDVYALGATAYHLLTGVAPAPAVDVMSGNAPLPQLVHQVNPSVAPAVSQAIARAMRVNRSERWATVSEFAAALRKAQSTPVAAADEAGVLPTVSAAIRTAPSISPAAPPGGGAAEAAGRQVQGQPARAVEQPRIKPRSQVKVQAAPALPRSTEKPFWQQKKTLFLLAVPAVIVCVILALVVNNIRQRDDSGLAEAPTHTAVAGSAGLPTEPRAGQNQATRPPDAAAPTPEPGAPPPATRRPPVPQFDYPSLPISPDNIGSLTQLARWGMGTLNMISLSRDGRLMAAASSLGIYIYAVNSLEIIAFIETSEWIDRVSLSPDGNRLAAVSWENIVRVWSLEGVAENGCPEGACPLIYTLQGHATTVRDVAFSPTGNWLVSASDDGRLMLWDMAGGESIRAMPVREDDLYRVVFSPDGTFLAAAYGSGMLRLWDSGTGRLLSELQVHEGAAYALAMAPGGNLLASTGDDETVRLTEIIRNEQDYSMLVVHSLPGAGETGYTDVAFSPDGQTLSVTDWSARARLWRTDNWAELRNLQTEMGGLINQAFYPGPGAVHGIPGDQALLTVAYDGRLVLWNYRNGELVLIKQDQGPQSICVAFAPDGTGLAVGYDNGRLAFFSPTSSEPLWENNQHVFSLNDVAFSEDGALLASGGQDLQVRLWDAHDGRLLNSLETSGPITALIFKPVLAGESDYGEGGNTLLAAGLENGSLQVWLVDAQAQARLLTTLPAHAEPVTSLAVRLEAAILLSGSMDGTIRAWNLKTGELANEIEVGEPVLALAVSANGQYLAASLEDSSAIIWSLQEGAPSQARRLTMEAGSLRSLAFSPDGQLLAIGSDWSRVLFWNTANASLVHTVYGPTSMIRDLAFSPDGHMLACVSLDGTVRIYTIP